MRDKNQREDVCARLSQDGVVDASAIEVEVENGEVTLRGAVGREARQRAADLIAAISGVRAVHNQLSLGHER